MSGRPPGGTDGRYELGMWQQFRRRRVTRTVLLYLAYAYLIVEGALTVATFMDLPGWALRAVFGAVVLGFPFTVVLAWTYDVTPSGIVRTPENLGPEPHVSSVPRRGWMVSGVGAVLGALILRLLRG